MLKRPHLRGPRRSATRGFSLVELMVGIAVGMFVVAAASLMTTTQLTDNRRLLLETQMQQDLRASADIIARELRRAGYSETAPIGMPPPAGGAVLTNQYSVVSPDAAASAVGYHYRRIAGTESFGFRLSSGKLQSCQSDYNLAGCTGTWQDLTDGATIRITNFAITTTRAGARAQTANSNALRIPCPRLCANGSTDCWPRVSVRELVITIAGESVSDRSVVRELSLSVRPRNDDITLSAEAPGGEACPA